MTDMWRLFDNVHETLTVIVSNVHLSCFVCWSWSWRSESWSRESWSWSWHCCSWL